MVAVGNLLFRTLYLRIQGLTYMESNFENLPKRIFLDSSVLQTLEDYGEYIYDVGELDNKILRIPNGSWNLNALRNIMVIAQRANFEFALSENSINQVVEKMDLEYTRWAYEMLDYWNGCINNYEDNNPYSSKGRKILERIKEEEFGYLGAKDKLLIFELFTHIRPCVPVNSSEKSH